MSFLSHGRSGPGELPVPVLPGGPSIATPGLTNCSPLPLANHHRRIPPHNRAGGHAAADDSTEGYYGAGADLGAGGEYGASGDPGV